MITELKKKREITKARAALGISLKGLQVCLYQPLLWRAFGLALIALGSSLYLLAFALACSSFIYRILTANVTESIIYKDNDFKAFVQLQLYMIRDFIRDYVAMFRLFSFCQVIFWLYMINYYSLQGSWLAAFCLPQLLVRGSSFC